MKKYYDKNNKQLIFINRKANPDFWDQRWGVNEKITKIKNIKRSFVSKITGKYITKRDGRILEGGCGKGHYVASLTNSGYQCIGLDFANQTVAALNKYIPELDIRHGDVRKLPFVDNYFIGYWSIGVIEHFWEGYEPIIKEASRVVSRNGYLFLIFPYMSFLRRLKARLGLYDEYSEELAPKDFYQFALNPKAVISNIISHDFKLIKTKHRTGILGAQKELSWSTSHDFKLKKTKHRPGILGAQKELSWSQGIWQFLYKYRSKNIIIRIIREGLELVLSPIAGHSILLIFKKQ
jgi:ubiquinone/menaquinone biosynthesis C-methylase UbiE